MSGDYATEHKRMLERKIRSKQDILPDYLKDYFLSINSLKASTRLNYTTDIYVFLEWLQEAYPEISGVPIKEIPVEIFKKITRRDLDDFIHNYSTEYQKELEKPSSNETMLVTRNNDYYGKARKLASIKRMYKYLVSEGLVDADPSSSIEVKKKKEDEVIYLHPKEIAILLDVIESENPLFDGNSVEYKEGKMPNGKIDEKKREKYRKKTASLHKKMMARDSAIITTLLGTGIRISECVGLNVNDVDFDEGEIHIIRKGGNSDTVYFNDEVEAALIRYLETREAVFKPGIDEEALFLSGGGKSSGKRLSVRQIEAMLKGYVKVALPAREKQISPHKLRSTFAMNLYNYSEIFDENGNQIEPDALLVATALGHKNISTVKKYTNASSTKKRAAFRSISLRKS